MSVEDRELQWVKLPQHLQKVSRLVLTGDYEKLAEYIAEAVSDLTGASVALWMMDEEGNVLRIRASRGLREEYVESAITPVEPGSSITSVALQEKRPVSRRDILDKMEKPPFYNMEEAIKQGWRSFLSVPLLGLEGQALGTLSIYYTEPRGFSESETALLWTFANQAAIAFENVQTMQELNTQLESLHRVVQEKSLEEVLRRILEGVNAILSEAIPSSSINLYEEKTGRFEPSLAMGPLQKLLQVAPRPDGTGTFVLFTGEALYLDDVHHPPSGSPTIRDESIATGIKSFAALPLRQRERVLGVLFVNLQKPLSFSEGIKRMLELFASQAAVAIENAGLFQELDDRAKRLVQLQEVTATISAEPSDLVKLLHSIVDSLRDIFKGASCAIRLYDSRKDEFGSRVAVGAVQELVDHPPRSEGTSRYIVRTREPLYIEDVSAAPPKGVPTLRREVLALGIRAAAYLPLRSEGKVIGILYMDLTESRRFSEYDKQILELFASQAAIAIENAQLLRDLDKRATQLLQLQDVTAAISAAPSDLEKVLHVIVKSLSGIFREVPCAIRLYDSRTGAFERRVAIGDLDEQLIYVPRADGATRYVVETRAPLYAEDTTAKLPNGKPVIRKELAKQGLGAVAYLPLLSGESVAGMLYLNMPTPYQFSQNDKQILELFANQAAIAVENARLFQELDERSRRLVRLQEVTATISTETSDLEKVLPLIVDSLSEIFWKAPCAIRPYDSTAGTFGDRISTGGLTDKLVFTPRPDGASRHVVSTKNPLYVGNTSVTLPDGQPAIREELVDEGVRAIAYLPLLSKGDMIGILYVNLTESYRFSEDDKQILELFADQAAIAIENARLYEAEQERRHIAETLRQVSTVLSSTLELDKVLELILQQLRQVIPYNSASVQRLQGKRLEIVTCQGFEEPDKVTGLVFPLDPKFPNYRVVTKKAPFAIEDVVQDYPHFKGEADRYESGHIRSWLGVPLMVKDQVIGIITLDRTEVRPYTAKESELAMSFANQAAITIENARLFEQLDRRVQELEVLTEIGRTVSNLGIDQILDLVYEQTAKIIDLSNAQVQIAFYDEAKDEVTFPLAVEQDNSQTIDMVRWGKREAPYREKGEDEVVEQFKPRARREPPGLNEYVIRTKRPLLIVEDFEQKAAEQGIKVWPKFGRLERPTHSWLGVPMMVANRVIGVISIQSLEVEHAYDQEHVELLATVASQAAVAIENARLYETLERKVEERTRELARLYETLERKVEERTRELKEAHERMAATEALVALGTVGASLQHRINSQLALLTPNLLRLRKRIDLSDPDAIQALEIMERSTEYLAKVTQRLLGPLRKEDAVLFDLDTVADTVIKEEFEVNPQYAKVITKRIDFQGDCRCRAGLGHISEVFRNLIENACETMLPQGGVLRISGWRTGDVVEVEITDTGKGIPEEIRDRLFNEPVPRKQPEEGSGIGLWLSRIMLQQYGGEIGIKQTGEALGTTLLLKLPAAKNGEEVNHG